MEFVLCASLAAGFPAGAASPAPQVRLPVTVRVALCQMSVADGDVRGNLAKIESQVKQATAQGARLCVFPELADVGFGPIVKAATGGEHARPIPGETTNALGRMAAAARVWIAIALLEQVSGGVFDTVVLIDDGGRAVLRQRKVFVYPYFGGAKAFQGNYHDAELIDSPWGPIGVMNCAEIDALAKRRVLTALRPSLMLVTLANPQANLPDNCPSLAREGDCIVVAVNQVFAQETANKGGKRRVCLSDGTTLWQADATESLKVAEIVPLPSKTGRPSSRLVTGKRSGGPSTASCCGDLRPTMEKLPAHWPRRGPGLVDRGKWFSRTAAPCKRRPLFRSRACTSCASWPRTGRSPARHLPGSTSCPPRIPN